jgi:TolB-like protein
MLRFLGAIFLFISACSTFLPATLQSKRSTDLDARKIRRIAVLLPNGMTPEAKSPAVYTSTPSSERKPSEEELSELLDRLVYSTMASMPNWQIVSEREVRDVAQSVPPGGDNARLRKIGEMVYADAVIVGRMQRYRERIGDEWGAKSPASVAFVLDLIDVRRGDVIWTARFDETQKALSENIFALGDISQRGIRWLSAEQLTQEGVKKAIGELYQILVRNPASS